MQLILILSVGKPYESSWGRLSLAEMINLISELRKL
jgi:hypothetical protein